MTEQEVRTEHQNMIQVIGFLGGLIFTALVLILQFPDKYRVAFWFIPAQFYFELLVTIMALAGAISVFTSLVLAETASGLYPTTGKLGSLVRILVPLTVELFMMILPMVLWPFTKVGAAVSFGAMIVLLAIILYYGTRPASSPKINAR